MYLITNYKETSKGLDIKGARLYLIADDKADAKEVLQFQQATAKGWKSNKAIIVDFPYVLNSEELVCAALQISDDVAARLIEAYSGVKVKVWESYESAANTRNAGAWAYIASEYMHDPWDTAGIFGSANCNK